MKNAHKAIITDEQFQEVQALKAKRQEIYGTNAFQAKYLLAGMLFFGNCSARYYHRSSGVHQYYSCYSRTKQVKNMVKNPNRKNDVAQIWDFADMSLIRYSIKFTYKHKKYSEFTKDFLY